jgi:zinc/manganese transport system ATP-binding protein/zinc transport system ATP-binding protein
MLHPVPHEFGPAAPIVEFRDVSCGYHGDAVITHINLKIMPFDFVGLLGPSGAGKTTILRAIQGAVEIYDGEVLVEGASTKRRRPRAGYVPQLEAVDWNFPVTVEQVVLMGRAADGWLPWPSKEDREKALEIMERLGIAHLRNRHIRELSGGQQQRVFLSRALISSPRLLLLDEPTVGVDIKTRDDILHLLDELNHEGVTVIMTTHELNAVAAHLPWVICLNRRIVAEGPPAEVYTPEVLKATYGAEMAVVEYNGLKLVAEMPHFLGREGRGRIDATIGEED